MFTELLPILCAVAAAFAVVAFFVVATRDPSTRPEMVSPFGPARAEQENNSSDTMVNQSIMQTVLTNRPDWKLATMDSLREAEDLLDYLENHNINDREFHTLANNCFAVRWK